MGDSESESESDEEISAALSMDPLVLLKVMSDISRMKSPSINQSMTLLLSSISIKDAKLSQETSITTRKRTTTETRTDTDKKSKRRRVTKARNIAEELKKYERVKKKCMCHLCYQAFHNESNLIRHLNNTNLHQNKYCVDYSNGNKKFRCGYCGKRLCNIGYVNIHIRTCHTKDAKYKGKCNTKRNNVDANLKEQKADMDRKCHYLLLCAECKVATTDLTRAVEHSQLHQLSGYNAFPRTCENCKWTFEDRDFEEHTSIHTLPDLNTMEYTPGKLLTCKWADIFQGLNSNLANQMKSSNIYEHTRKVKMNIDDIDEDDVSGKPLYQCETCGMIVRPEAVEDHCNKENECVHNDLEYEVCEECDGFFESPEALLEHEKDEEAGVRFRIIRFNGENDLPMNRALRNLRPNSQLLEVNSQTEGCSTVEPDTHRNGNEVHENRITNITRYCQDCGRSVPNSDFEDHEAAHRDEFIAAIENGEYQSSDEEVSEERETSNALDDTPEEIDVDENAMDNDNSVSNRIVSLNYICVGHNMRADRENLSISNITVDKNPKEMVPYKENSINNSGGKVSELSEEGGFSNNSKEVEHINEQTIDHVNSSTGNNIETKVILQTVITQLDEAESIRNTTLQIDIGQVSENQSSTGLNADDSFRPIENDSRPNVRENSNKKLNVTISDIIYISDESEYENDRALEEVEALDDKSKINRIDISAINNEQSYETIDLTEECEYDEGAIMLQDLSDDLDDEITAERIQNEHQLFIEMEQKIKKSLSKRD